MAPSTERFVRWRRQAHDDVLKEWFVSYVGGSWVDDAAALERVNRDRGAMPPVTEGTVRTWTRDDPEFADALKVARWMREDGRRRLAEQAEDAADRWFVGEMNPDQWQRELGLSGTSSVFQPVGDPASWPTPDGFAKGKS